jgi:hypothetical protein
VLFDETDHIPGVSLMGDWWIRVVLTAGMALYLDSVWWLICLGMWTEGRVVSMVFHDGHFQHFHSLALLFLLGTLFAISSKVGLILCIFKDPPGILIVFCHV